MANPGRHLRTAIPCSEIEGLRSLRLPDVRTLAGLDRLTGLQSLVVESVENGDLTPLGVLTALRSLTLGPEPWETKPRRRRVALPPALSSLPHLEELRVRETELAAVPPLRLPALRILELERCKLRSIDAIAGAEQLIHLDVRGNEISDVSPLARLAALEDVDLGENPVEDLSPLRAARFLRVLKIDGTGVRDVGPLEGLPALRELWACGTPTLTLHVVRGLRRRGVAVHVLGWGCEA
jgi:internalin A